MPKILDSLRRGPASDAEIRQLEALAGVSLPADYREFLKTHNGGRPVPDSFVLPYPNGEEGEAQLVCFFPLWDGACEDGGENLVDWPLHCAWEDLRDDLAEFFGEIKIEPGGVLLPIGHDGFGNYVLLFLGGTEPDGVVMLDHDGGTFIRLADGFTKFLDGLHPSRHGNDGWHWADVAS